MKVWRRQEYEKQVATCLGLVRSGTCRRSIRAGQRSRSKPHERRPLELSLSVKVPGEQRRSGVGAGVTAVDQGVAEDELQSVIGTLLGVGPRCSDCSISGEG